MGALDPPSLPWAPSRLLPATSVYVLCVIFIGLVLLAFRAPGSGRKRRHDFSENESLDSAEKYVKPQSCSLGIANGQVAF